ncbi:hypothetical protein L7F22_053729 [Adiantum nelumboides]|nr:hypothetical protein [Adiantum nelumboides]
MQRSKILELENAKLKEEVISLKEEMAASKELREEGKIQETDKVTIKEEITKEITKAMEVKMEATKEGWVDVVRNKIKKEVKKEKQHEETLWMHTTLEEKKMREAHMLNVRDVHIIVLDVSAKVDFYVMPSKGKGYPLILGRPWLMELNADQKWGSSILVLQKSKRIVYDMKLGKQPNICFETSTDEESSDESSYGDEESYTSEESSMEVMGLVFQQPQAKGSSTSKEVEVTAQEEPMLEERLRKMLAKDLTKEEEEDYIDMFKRACKACQQAGDRKLSYGPRFPFFAYGPFEKLGIDAIGPLPRTSTGKQYILTATDCMTRWAEAASVAHITAVEVSKFVLDYMCSRFGTPLEILSDRGIGFRADLLDALLENLSIKHVHSTPYYPQCNGLVEKKNGVLCKIITKHVRDRLQGWDKHLTTALWAYRTSFKVSTQFTPYHLVYGQEALFPIEVELGSLRVLAKKNISSKEKLEQRIIDLQCLDLDREAATDYYITQANKKKEQFNNKVKEKKLEEGMPVMRYDSRLDLSHKKNFLQRWEGPYVIFKKFKNESYRLKDISSKVHKYPTNGWRLKEFFQCIQPLNEG